MRDQCTLNLADYCIDGNLISGGPLYSNTLSILIWLVFTNTHIPINPHTQTSVASHSICECVWSEEELGLTGPRCPGLGLQALRELESGTSPRGSAVLSPCLRPSEDLFDGQRQTPAGPAPTGPLDVWRMPGCQCLTVMRTQINNNINTHAGLYRWCCVFAVHMHWRYSLVRIREKWVWIWIPAFYHPFS